MMPENGANQTKSAKINFQTAEWLLACMLGKCTGILSSVCRTSAQLYFGAVVLFGQEAFDEGQEDCCD